MNVAVFVDGGYYSNMRGIRIEEILKIAGDEGDIVQKHYFRGRFSSRQMEERYAPDQLKEALLRERTWDGVLQRAGFITHYIPMGKNEHEKGVDVAIAVEAMALAREYELFVLVAGDGDFVPLVNKLNVLGISSVIIGVEIPGQTWISPRLREAAFKIVDFAREE